MPSYKNVWSSVRYHGVTAPAIRGARVALGHAGKAIHAEAVKRFPGLKQYIGSPSSSKAQRQRRSKILRQTRGSTGENPRVWSKSTLSGVKRRQEAAAKAKAARRAKANAGQKGKARVVGAKVRTNSP